MHCENPKIINHLPHILDTGDEKYLSITIKKGACQKYLFVPEKNGEYERHFIIEEGSVFRGGAILIGTNMVLKMTVSIMGSQSEASLELLALARDNAILEIDGIGKVSHGCEHIKLRVDQTNILLGENARVRGRPVLEIETDSIEGGHSCKIHQISKDKLFYLESHGIDTETAEGMLLEGEIGHHLHIIDRVDESLKDEILAKLF